MAEQTLYTEKELLERLIAGDERAFDLLYHQYSKRIYANTLRLVKDEEFAQEILQEVFIRIWQQRERLDADKSFSSYLFTITQNLIRDFFRKAARDRKLQAMLISVGSELYEHIESTIFHKETNAILNEAIEQLPLQRKRIFTLCKIEGKSYDEVAAIMGISVSTVGNQLVKATRSIRQHFLLSENCALLVTALVVFTKQ